MRVLRKVLQPMDELAPVEFLLSKLQDTKTKRGLLRVDEALAAGLGGAALILASHRAEAGRRLAVMGRGLVR